MRADVALGIVAVLAGALWRLEVEWRGWAGLAWIEYFHLAVPVGVALFLVWTWFFLDVASGRKRAAVVAVLALFASLAVPFTEWSLRMAFNRFFFMRGFLKLLLFWWLLSPSLVAGVLRAFRVPVTLRSWALSQALFVGAWPIATAVAEVFPQHGYADAIHAFKSGLVVPFFVVALGILVPTRELARPSRDVRASSL